jgi:hypothetical protein
MERQDKGSVAPREVPSTSKPKLHAIEGGAASVHYAQIKGLTPQEKIAFLGRGCLA